MAMKLKIEFDRFKAPNKGVLVVFCDDALKMGAATRNLLGDAAGLIARAAEADGFTGKSGSALDIIAPAGLKAARLVVVGCGKPADLKAKDFLKLGGVAVGKVPAAAKQATVIAELPAAAMSPDAVAGVATGAMLRTYSFDRYKTKKKEGEDKRGSLDLTIATANPAAAKRAWAASEGLAEGVVWARDLINEPANVLYPEEFARRTGGAAQARRHRRHPRREGDEAPRHELAARRRPGLGA